MSEKKEIPKKTIKVAHILKLNTNCNFQATDDF